MFGKLKYLHHSQKHIEKDEDGDFFFFLDKISIYAHQFHEVSIIEKYQL